MFGDWYFIRVDGSVGNKAQNSSYSCGLDGTTTFLLVLGMTYSSAFSAFLNILRHSNSVGDVLTLQRSSSDGTSTITPAYDRFH